MKPALVASSHQKRATRLNPSKAQGWPPSPPVVVRLRHAQDLRAPPWPIADTEWFTTDPAPFRSAFSDLTGSRSPT